MQSDLRATAVRIADIWEENGTRNVGVFVLVKQVAVTVDIDSPVSVAVGANVCLEC